MQDFQTLPSGVWQQTLVVQKSRFVAFATRVDNVEQARAFLQSVALPGATHHCYAYLTMDGQKSSDHGEPSGTAGLPILQAIKQQKLSNVAVAVERFFGGIKLGTGGLARAYVQAATQVLTAATAVWVRDCALLEFNSTYDYQTVLTQLINTYGKVMAVEYQAMIHWRVAVPVVRQADFIQQCAEVVHRPMPITVLTPHSCVELV